MARIVKAHDATAIESRRAGETDGDRERPRAACSRKSDLESASSNGGSEVTRPALKDLVHRAPDVVLGRERLDAE